VRGVADRGLIRGPDGATFKNVAKTREPLAERQLEKRLAVFVEEIEREESDRRIAQERF
jgi:hypothetical protein